MVDVPKEEIGEAMWMMAGGEAPGLGGFPPSSSVDSGLLSVMR